MPILFECSSCKAAYDINNDLAGKMIVCRECDCRGEVAAAKATVVCPSCRQGVEAAAAMVGHWMRCPSCQALFKARAGGDKRLTRRQALIGASAVLLSGLTVTGVVLSGRPKAVSMPSGEEPRRGTRNREEVPEGQTPTRPARGRGRGQRRR